MKKVVFIFLYFLAVYVSAEQKDDSASTTPISSNSKFDFEPHFDQATYDFMIPGGVNKAESSVSMVRFYGLLTEQTPHFDIEDDVNGWFKIGQIETIKESDYKLSTFALLLKKDVDVVSVQKDGVYSFKIRAADNGTLAEAGINVEILSFEPPIPSVLTTTTATETTSARTEGGTDKTGEVVESKDATTVDVAADLISSTTPSRTEGSAETEFSGVKSSDAEAPAATLDISPTTAPVTEKSAEKTTEKVLTELGVSVADAAADFSSTTLPVTEEAEETTVDLKPSGQPEEAEAHPPVDVSSTSTPMAQDIAEKVVETEPPKPAAAALDISPAPTPGTSSSSENTAEASTIVRPPTETPEGTSVEELELDLLMEFFNAASSDHDDQNATATETTAIDVSPSTSASTSATVPAAAPLPPISLQIVDVRTQLPVTDMRLNNSKELTFFEIRTTLAPGAALEMVELTVEPASLFEIRPKFVLNNVPARLRANPAHFVSASSETEPISVVVTARYADVDSDVFTEAAVTIQEDIKKGQVPVFEKSKFEFEIAENSVPKTLVGAMPAVDPSSETKDGSALIYSLIGRGSELFLMDSGKLVLMCPENSKNCLDREEQDAFHLIALATTLSGVSSDPVTVVIHVIDEDDNAPEMILSKKALQVADGRVTEPFLVKIHDADSDGVDSNVLVFDGSAATFLRPRKISKNSFTVDVVEDPEIGGYVLDVAVFDGKTKKLKSKKQSVQVEVLTASKKARFGPSSYDKTVKSVDVVKGAPLAKLQFHGQPVETVHFLFLEGNPGWLRVEDFGGSVSVSDVPVEGVPAGIYSTKIAAVDRQSNRILDECQFRVVVEGGLHLSTLFAEKVFTFSISQVDADFVFYPLVDSGKAVDVVDNSLYAYDGQLTEVLDILPESIKIEGGSVKVPAKVLRNVKSIQFQLQALNNENDRALVTIYVVADAAAYKNKKLQLSMPRFSTPWTDSDHVITVKLPEEAPLGHTVLHLSAFNPETTETVQNVELQGQMADYFLYDPVKKSLLTNKLLDFEALSTKKIDLLLVAKNGAAAPTGAKIQVLLQNLDDNCPQILSATGESMDTPLRLTVEENISPGKPLIELLIRDRDVDSPKQFDVDFDVKLVGKHADNFQIVRTRDGISLLTSPTVDLDHESNDELLILVVVTDGAGNKGVLEVVVKVVDANDNRPLLKVPKNHLNAVENWPSGAVVGILFASDKDNDQVKFNLTGAASEFLTVNEKTGEISTTKALTGLSSFDPHLFSVSAIDSGSPNFTATADFEIRVHDASILASGDSGNVRFVSPSPDFVLSTPETVAVNTKLWTVQVASDNGDSREADSGNSVHYSLIPVSSEDEGWLGIDQNSGDIYVQNSLDFETAPFVSVQVVASNAANLEKNMTRLFRVAVQDADENEPQFVVRSDDNGLVTFVVDDTLNLTSSTVVIGKLHAIDRDSGPFNAVFYYLFNCGGADAEIFGIDKNTGELYMEQTLENVTMLTDSSLCALVSPTSDLSKNFLDSIEFDQKNSSMTRIMVKKLSTLMTDSEVQTHHLGGNLDNHILDVDLVAENMVLPLDLQSNESSAEFLYKLDDVQFSPLDPSAQKSPDHRENQHNSNIFVDPDTGHVRVDPETLDSPEGIYKLVIKIFNKKDGHFVESVVRQVHRVKAGSKLKFVFDGGLNQVGLKLDSFKNRLQSLLRGSKVSEDLDIVLAPPRRENRVKTTVCFYLARPGSVVSLNESIHLTAQQMNANDAFTSLYQEFDVINIEPCVAGASVAAAAQMPQELMLWLLGAFIGLIVLFALICYTCFIARYRDHLKKKSTNLEEAKLPIPDPFNVPQFIDPRKF